MQTKSLCMQNCFRCTPMRMGNCAHKKTRHVDYILIITCNIGIKWQTPYIYFFLQPPPPKSWIFQWTPKILKFFMLNTSLAPPPFWKFGCRLNSLPSERRGGCTLCWTTDLFLKISVQLLLTHCQISLSIWRPYSIWISNWDRYFNLEFKIRLQKTEYQMLNFGFGTTVLETKNAMVVVFLFS